MTVPVQFNKVPKDRLFYNQYEYCVGFRLDEVSCLKIIDHDYVDTVLARRIEWRDLHRRRQQAGPVSASFASIHTRLAIKPIITPETAQNLHDLVDLLLSTTDSVKLVTSVDRAWIYTNNPDLLDQVNQMSILEDKFYTQAVINRPANSIRLKRSQYQYRSYFKTLKLTSQQKTQLDQFFTNQQDAIRVSPSAAEWLAGGYLRTQDYFFIDHAGETWLVLLALVCPGLIRKTVEIITD